MKFLGTGFDCHNFTGLHIALGIILRCFFMQIFINGGVYVKRKQ